MSRFLQRLSKSVLTRPGKSLPRGRRRPQTLYRFPKLRLESLEGRDLFAARLTLSGAQTLAVNANVNVSNNTATGESEMYVDVNPTNPLNLAGFVHNYEDLSQIQLFFSMNGGLTWTRRIITKCSPCAPGFIDDGIDGNFRFDPTIAFDANGRLYVGYGANAPGTRHLRILRSDDGGNSFPAMHFTSATVEPGIDKWHLATGPSGFGDQAVYIAWTRNIAGGQRIAVAGRRANTVGWFGGWVTAPVINDTGNGVLFAHPAVGPTGQLYVSWDNYGTGIIYLDRDLNGLFGGLNFGTDIRVRTGMTLGVRDLLPVQNRRGVSANPTIAVDRSGGPFNGCVYIAFGDRYAPGSNDTDIYLARSSDQGATWTVPPAGVPGNVEGASSTDWHPTVAVDQDTGAVGVAYYSGQGLADNTQTHLWMASSTDGGASFVKARVTTLGRQSRPSSMSYAGEFLEYIGLAYRHGTFHPFWADNRGPTPGTFSTDAESYSASGCTRSGSNSLVVTGSNLGETIILRRSPVNPAYAEVIVNGQRQWAGLWCALGRITINALAGNDTITVEDTVAGVPVTVNADAGDDTVNIAPTVGGNLDRIDAPITANAGAGLDRITFNDQNNALSDTWTVNSNVITRTRSAEISYFGFNNGVIINGGSGNPGYNVWGTTAFANGTIINSGNGVNRINVRATTGPLVVNAGNGNDIINVGSGGPPLATSTINAIQGAVSVYGEAGTDTLHINDQSLPPNPARTYTVWANSVQRLGPPVAVAAINFFGVEFKDLSFSGSVNVLATEAGTTTTITTGSGDDTFNVGPSTLDMIQGALTLDGQGGTDVLNLSDEGTGGARSYMLTSTSLVRSGAALITYAAVDMLTLHGGGHGNTITVESTAAGTSATVNAGAGADTITVGTATHSLSWIQGVLSIQGQGGDDLLTITDQAATGAHVYRLTADYVDRDGSARMTYGTVEALVLAASNQDDTITVESTSAGTTVHAGQGDDAITVGDAAHSLSWLARLLTLDGGGHVNGDAVTVHDGATSAGRSYTLNGFGELWRDGWHVLSIVTGPALSTSAPSKRCISPPVTSTTPST